MKLIKRTLVCMLATLLLLTAAPLAGIVALADSELTITLDQPLAISVEPDESTYAHFTPAKTGLYHIYSTGVGDVKCYVYDDAFGNEIGSDNDSGDAMNFDMYVKLDAGVKYVLDIQSYEEYTATTTVYVEESDIASVEFEDVSVIYDAYYYWESKWIDDDQWVEWKEQDYADFIPYTVTKKDGTVLTPDDIFLDLYVEDDQNHENEWKEGNTYTATVSAMGFTDTIQVTMLENPIQSVTVIKKPVIEKTNGDWRHDECWDEELQEWVYTPEYWYYNWNIRCPDEVILSLKDGSTYTVSNQNNYFEWYGCVYHLEVSSDQSYENAWHVGKNAVEGSIANYRFEYEVEIIESPIRAVKAEPIYLLEEVDGRWETTDYYDENGEWVQSPEYFCYHTIRGDVTVTLNDGTEYFLPANQGEDRIVWNGYVLELNWWSDQDYFNQWTVGKNTAYGEIGGYEFTYDTYVVEVEANDQFQYIVVDGGAIITDCFSGQAVIEIPEILGDYPVVGVSDLGEHWEAEELILPDSVVTVDEQVFWNMWNLEKIHFGAKVEDLIPDMFWDLGCLSQITVSSANPHYCAVDNVLYDKAMTKVIALASASIDSYVVPASVMDIDTLFLPIYSAVSISFAPGNQNFVTENKVTYNKDKTQIILVDKSLSGSYTMPSTVVTIAPNAFRGCKNLTQVTVSANVTEIAYGAFAQCTALNKVALPTGLIGIEIEAFMDDTALTSVTLPEELEYVGPAAFAYSGLTSLKVPDSVLWIAEHAFRGSEIATLDLGEGVEEIYSMAFAYTDITSVVLPDSLYWLGGGAFECCDSLASVTLSKNLTEICSYTFYKTALTELTLPEHIEYVGSWAFAGTPLTEVAFGNPAVWLDEGTFSGCPLTTLNLGDEMEWIPDYAFSETNIKTLTVPDSVTAIMYGAFMGSEQLATIDIPTGVVEMGAHVFDDTVWYEAQPEGITYLEHVLYDYKGVMPNDANLVVKDGTTVIADFAFANTLADQENLREIYIPASVEHIGDQVFGDNQDLTITGVKGSCAEEYAYYFGYDFVAKALNGWIKSGNHWLYYKNGAMVISQWIKDGGKWYYLDHNGIMAADTFVKDSNGLAYLTPDGAMSTASGWVSSGGKWYYLNSGYATISKWVKDSKGWCYLNADGIMATNAWVKDGNKWCYLGSNGYMTKSAWIKDGGKWYYLDAYGYMVTNTWKKDSKGWCYLGTDGAMKTNAWVKDSVGWCYVGGDGYAVTNCWKKDSHGWCYLNANGSMTKNAWIKDDGKWYYLDANGYMVTNAWKKDSKGWVYVGANGAMLTNAWCKDSKGWCYVGDDGYAVTNCWKKDSKGWIWLDKNGSMTKSEWIKDDGKWYYLDKNGYMIAGKTVTIGGEKYTFNANGVWVG